MHQIFRWVCLSLLWLLGCLFIVIQIVFKLSPLAPEAAIMLIATLAVGLGVAGCLGGDDWDVDGVISMGAAILIMIPVILIGELFWWRVHLLTASVVVSCSLVGVWLAWQRLELEHAWERAALANKELQQLLRFGEIGERTRDRLGGLTDEYVDSVRQFVERSR